jgi:hypothetical protein
MHQAQPIRGGRPRVAPDDKVEMSNLALPRWMNRALAEEAQREGRSRNGMAQRIVGEYLRLRREENDAR